MSLQSKVNQLIGTAAAVYSQSDAFAARKEKKAAQRELKSLDAQIGVQTQLHEKHIAKYEEGDEKAIVGAMDVAKRLSDLYKQRGTISPTKETADMQTDYYNKALQHQDVYERAMNAIEEKRQQKEALDAIGKQLMDWRS